MKIWRVRRIEFKIWEVLVFFSPKCEFYLVFQVLTEWRYFLSTLITPYFKEENWTTMFVVDLVTRSTTGSWKTSIRLSKVVKLLTENWCVVFVFKWKHDAFNTNLIVFFPQLQIWCAVKPLSQNLTRFQNFHFKILLFWRSTKMQNMSLSRSKINPNVVLCMQKFFETWHVQIFLIQNLTRYIFFIPKSDAL